MPADNFRLRWHQLQVTTRTEPDVQAERRFGREVAARILASEKRLEAPALTRYINLIGASLASHGQRSDIPYYFAILDSEGLGAYSTPGGYVFISHGLLQLVENEAELAAILAHEIAHINLMHIVDELDIKSSNQEELSVIARLIGATGSTTQVAFKQAVDNAIAFLFKEGFKQHQELAADRTAADIMALTGYNPAALQDILQRIRRKEGSENHRTHPDFSQRHQQLQHHLTQQGMHAAPFKLGLERFKQTLARN